LALGHVRIAIHGRIFLRASGQPVFHLKPNNPNFFHSGTFSDFRRGYLDYWLYGFPLIATAW